MPSRDQLARAFHAAGYPLVLAALALWLSLLVPRRLSRARWRAALGAHGPALALAAALCASILLASPPRFRVLNDEALLMNAAFSMVDHGGFEQCSGIFRGDELRPVGPCWWDKRPLAWPMLVSLVHRLRGYSPDNGFVANALAATGTLFVLQLLVRRWLGGALATAAMLALAAFPLFALGVTSAGFEVANLGFALLAFLFLDRWLASGDARELERLAFTLVLLAQVRYESILFAAAMAPVVLWRLRGLPALGWRSALLPVLLLPVVWQRWVETAAGHAWTPAGHPPFALVWLRANLAGAWRFYAGEQSAYGTIPLVSLLALVGAPFALAGLWRARRDPRAVGLALAALAAALLQAGVTFSYYWGDLTRHTAMRLGIVFLPGLIVLALLPLAALARRWRPAAGVAIAGAAALLWVYRPVAGRNEAMARSPLHREYHHVLALLDAYYRDADVLVLTSRPMLYTFQRRSSVTFRSAERNAPALLEGLRSGRFDEILAVQRIARDSGEAADGTAIAPVFELEPVAEAPLASQGTLRISRVRPQPPGSPPKNGLDQATPPST